MLSERQQRILRIVMDSYLESGQPVGSKVIADREDVEWSASTIRSELAKLESSGYLTHPHTSAGRVPTDSGYRFYADALLSSATDLAAPAAGGLELSRMRREVDEAMRETTVALSQVNELRAVSVVGANYGLGYRNLGTVGVVGPLRMDYATAIASVRDAAGQLSRFFETVYEG